MIIILVQVTIVMVITVVKVVVLDMAVVVDMVAGFGIWDIAWHIALRVGQATITDELSDKFQKAFSENHVAERPSPKFETSSEALN